MSTTRMKSLAHCIQLIKKARIDPDLFRLSATILFGANHEPRPRGVMLPFSEWSA
jgi:hypothetical protein